MQAKYKKIAPALLLLSTLASSLAQAAPPNRAALPTPAASPVAPNGGTGAFRMAVSVDAIKIQNLQQHAGKKLHVFYVSGREAALGFSGQTLKIRAIKQVPTSFEIGANGEVLIPATVVSNSGFQTFNYIVLGITPKERTALYLRNSDGTYPEDPRSPNYLSLKDADFKSDKLGFVSMIQLNDMRNAHFEGTSRTEGAMATEASPIILDGLKDF